MESQLVRFALDCQRDVIITTSGRMFTQERGSPWVVRELDSDVEDEDGGDAPYAPISRLADQAA